MSSLQSYATLLALRDFTHKGSWKTLLSMELAKVTFINKLNGELNDDA